MIISHGRNSYRCSPNLAHPISEWTIPSYSSSYVSCSGDTFHLRGAGGWHEIAWWAFDVEKPGSYEFSYDYDIPYFKFWSSPGTAWNHFGLYIASNNPHGLDGDSMQYYFEKSQNRMGSDIISNTNQAYNLTGHKTSTLTLSTGRYWLWFPGAIADDYIDLTFTFTNIVVKLI